jgi:DUF4097 and DUF4098 domain-containing protein YvlB
VSMSIHCENCGAEIFAGQRFCRSCGRPTNQYTEENAPTQMMPPSATAQRAPVDTAPPARPFTSPVYTPPGYYQPPQARLPVPTYTPPQARSGWVWIVGIIGVVMLSLLTMGVFVFSRVSRRPPRFPPPPPPPRQELRDLGFGGREVVTSEETTTTRSFPLSATAKFALQNTNGNITIEAWDKSQAEVITIKRGGSEQDRGNLKLIQLTEGGNLSLQTPTARGIEVEYIVKLPRKLGEISLESTNSEIQVAGLGGKVTVKNANGGISLSRIKGSVSVTTLNGSTELSDVGGDVSITSTNGGLDLTDIDGAIDARSTNGAISVAFESVVPSKSLKFESTRGAVELKFAKTPDADFTIDTVSGTIDIDQALHGDTKFAGRGATGRLGKGGLPLSIKTVVGTITITK